MDINFDFFEIRKDKIAGKGRILISEPYLSDTYFKRSVVFLTEHNTEGSVGFVLNKPIDVKLQDVLQDFPDLPAGISIGGPVNTNTVHYLHTFGDLIPESVHVKDNIYWGGDFEALKNLIIADQVQKGQVRFFLGYSGWSPDQLEEELKQNAWLVADINSEHVMAAEKESFWNEVLEVMKDKYKVWANFPENPDLN